MKLYLALSAILLTSIACKEVAVISNECLMPPEQSVHGLITEKEYRMLNKFVVNEDGEEEAQPLCVMPELLDDVSFTVDYQLKDYDEAQTAKFHQVIEKVLVVLASKEFKQKVLDHEFKGKKTFHKPVVQGVTLTNEEVYNTILKGSELLLLDRTGVGADQEMDLKLKMYYSKKNVVGWTEKKILTINTNAKYYNVNTHGKVGANFVHEWLHKLGFGHDYKRTSVRPFSVPYGVGGIITELISKMNPTTEQSPEIASL